MKTVTLSDDLCKQIKEVNTQFAETGTIDTYCRTCNTKRACIIKLYSVDDSLSRMGNISYRHNDMLPGNCPTCLLADLVVKGVNPMQAHEIYEDVIEAAFF